MSLWPYALTLACSVAASIIGSSWVQWRRERKQERREVKGIHELAKQFGQMQKDYDMLTEVVVGLRIELARVKGRMNFKGWRQEEN